MAVARSYAVGLVGLDGHVVEVEADLAQGLPGLTVIGLPDAALAEARDRVRAAMVNSGQHWPATKRVTVNLSPASLPKRRSSFDLSIAAAILAAQEVVPPQVFDDAVLLEAAIGIRVTQIALKRVELLQARIVGRPKPVRIGDLRADSEIIVGDVLAAVLNHLGDDP